MLMLLVLGSCSSSLDENLNYQSELYNLDEQALKASEWIKEGPSVFFFLSPECPLCIDYAFLFRDLSEEYGQKGVNFYGIFPGTYFSPKQIRKYQIKYQLDFDFLLDPDYEFTRELEASTTPEIYFADEFGNLIYRGAPDNWAYKVGHKRLEATEHYFKDALLAFEQGESAPKTRTEPVGCFIE
jgi:peroxiredoxin